MKNPIKILHIVSKYPPALGGTATSVPYLADEQSKQGHEVHVLTFGDKDEVETNGNITIHRIRLSNKKDNIVTGMKKSAILAKEGRSIVKKHNIDIIHSHDPNVSAITKMLMDPLRKIPSVIIYSGDLAWETLGLKSPKYIENPDSFWSTPKAKALMRIEKKILSSFDCTIAQNRYQQGMLINHVRLDKKKIDIVPYGIKIYSHTEDELKKAAYELKDIEGPKLFSAARLVPWKGIDCMIDAMEDIDGTYIIYGDGPYRKTLEHKAKEKKLGSKVRFMGPQPHEKVQQMLKVCDILIVPSIYEPFGIILLDGFAAHVPVIGSDTGGIENLLDKECLFNPKNPEEIKEKIKYAMENKKSILESQDRKIKNFSWEKVAEDIEEIYTRLILARIRE